MKLITANKLNRFWHNGVLAKMVAKAKVLNTTEEIEANTSAENVAGALVAKELYNNLTALLSGEVLWENPSPASQFAGQTVTLTKPVDEFKYFRVFFSINNVGSSNSYVDSGRILLNSLGLVTDGISNQYRNISFSSSSAKISDTYQIGSTGTFNSAIIPKQIIGYKY